MKNKIFIIILFFSLTYTNSFCQVDTLNQYYNSIGIKYSNISGYGIFYNRKLSESFHLQIMGLAYYFQSKNNNFEHINFNYDFGLEIQRNIAIGDNYRIYFLAGGFYYLDNDEQKFKENSLDSVRLNHSFNVGVGLVGEYHYQRFFFHFELGYKFFEDRIEITVNNTQPYPELKRMTKIGAGLGVGFTF
jgi:hypothetical protein